MTAFLGLIVNYLFGVTYMYIMMNTWMNMDIAYGLGRTGMIPFLIKDGPFSFFSSHIHFANKNVFRINLALYTYQVIE